MTTNRLQPRAAATPPTRLVHRYGLSVLGVVSVLLTSAGMTGVGDAPDPHDAPAAMAAHFLTVSDAVIRSAPLGYLGAVGIAAFLILLGRRLRAVDGDAWDGRPATGIVMHVSGILIAGYLAALHVVYTSLSYQIAEFSPQATQALFVPTILAVPAVGAVTAALLATAARAAQRASSMPSWWPVTTAAGAIVASVAIVSFEDGGFLSPDVQQQAIFNIVLVWILLTSFALASRTAHVARQHKSLRTAGSAPRERTVT